MATTTGMGTVSGDYVALIQPPYGENPAVADFDPKYLRFETSGLKFAVQPGDNFFEIKLDRAKKR